MMSRWEMMGLILVLLLPFLALDQSDPPTDPDEWEPRFNLRGVNWQVKVLHIACSDCDTDLYIGQGETPICDCGIQWDGKVVLEVSAKPL